MSTAIAAYGTLLLRGDGGGSEVFTAVAEVTKIDSPALKLDTADVTTHGWQSTFTVTGTSTTFTLPAGSTVSDMPVGTTFRVASTTTLPSGLVAATDYIVLTVVSPTVRTIGTLAARAAITFADAGTGTHTLTAGRGWKENIGLLKDGGDVSFECNFVPTNVTQNGTAGLILDLKNATLRNFKIQLPDTTLWPFSALVTGMKASAPVDGKLAFTGTLKISGQPTTP